MISFIKKEIVFVIGSIMMLGILVGGPVRQQIALSKKDTVYQVPVADVSRSAEEPTVVSPAEKETTVVPVQKNSVPIQRPVRERENDQNDD